MAEFDLEYTVCVIQRNVFSFAAKSHRQEQGDPKLLVDIAESNVVWTLSNIDHGIPEVVTGTPQADRIDFYFRHENLRDILPNFPSIDENPNNSFKLLPTDSTGTERTEGKRIRIVQPVCRFFPIPYVQLLVNKTPSFEAIGRDAYLHLDFETGPARIYGREIFEVHFGVEASYVINALDSPQPSQARIVLSHELYATILNELKWVLN